MFCKNMDLVEIYKVIYNLSVYIKTFHIRLHLNMLKVKLSLQKFQQVYHRRYIIWWKFVWSTYSKSYMAFQFTL